MFLGPRQSEIGSFLLTGNFSEFCFFGPDGPKFTDFCYLGLTFQNSLVLLFFFSGDNWMGKMRLYSNIRLLSVSLPCRASLYQMHNLIASFDGVSCCRHTLLSLRLYSNMRLLSVSWSCISGPHNTRGITL